MKVQFDDNKTDFSGSEERIANAILDGVKKRK
jgi:hypothetical protein